MAINLECSECEHVQSVGQIDNGLGGHPDPKTTCKNCGAKGSFHFIPGTKAQARRRAEELELSTHHPE
ncbi:MAG TPA: hypothetical protein VMR75_04065 [Candidatus Saccharimonadales bacterium]|nr:hypothetical protein [Candidatus Saccharimonadales bacterium]